MGAIGKYFKKQLRVQMCFLGHDTVSDFYVSCWQKNQSVLPSLYLRVFLFLTSLGILLYSMIGSGITIQFWFIYLTHWGLILITVTTGFALAISFRALHGPTDATYGLPWYVKAYWVFYNITNSIAFLITVFYWVLLRGADFMVSDSGEMHISLTVDVLMHGVNSIIMLILIVSSRQPSLLLHVYQPILCAAFYMLFSIIYYNAGGTDPFGNVWIYPMLDWSNPGPTMITVVGSALLLLILHIVVVVITLIRDHLTRRYRKDSQTFPVYNGY